MVVVVENYDAVANLTKLVFFFFQAEDGIRDNWRDWSSDVCSSDLAEQLPVGDYVLSDRVVVERKTGADLAASIKDRRLFEQIERLGEAYPAVVLVVEGEPMHIAERDRKSVVEGKSVDFGGRRIIKK